MTRCICFSGLGVHYFITGIGHIRGAVIKNGSFIGIREHVLQTFFAKVEFLVGRMAIITRKVGAEIAAKPGGRRVIEGYRTATQMIQPFKNPYG